MTASVPPEVPLEHALEAWAESRPWPTDTAHRVAAKVGDACPMPGCPSVFTEDHRIFRVLGAEHLLPEDDAYVCWRHVSGVTW